MTWDFVGLTSSLRGEGASRLNHYMEPDTSPCHAHAFLYFSYDGFQGAQEFVVVVFVLAYHLLPVSGQER
ncbi:hypothetical protein M2164_000220 [Streptomyces sp. SAI-208]|uniref:hypothetical protein n=1 Tax=Streptomyces sp. SAI-208 TaxID=2940550 RepID=UPI002476435B|nr:hypothetical protein [Streptomyces sp. SAI-208]MDH6604585.1 hypothetical protein [Streptomyces sp. SAI-208]